MMYTQSLRITGEKKDSLSNLPQHPTASKWRSQNLNPDLSDSKAMLAADTRYCLLEWPLELSWKYCPKGWYLKKAYKAVLWGFV